MEHKTLGLRAGTEPCKLERNCLHFTWPGYKKQSYQGSSLTGDPLPASCNPTYFSLPSHRRAALELRRKADKNFNHKKAVLVCICCPNLIIWVA